MTLLALHSDSYGGHKLGLANPATMLPAEDEWGNPYEKQIDLEPVQRWLWGKYQQDITTIWDLADSEDLVVIHNGDCCHGDKHPEQLISTRRSDQVIIATDNARPWLDTDQVRAFRFMVGTGAHNFGEGTAETLVAMRLRAEYRGNIAVRYHGLFSVDGVTVDVAHHGPGPGIRVWTRGNQVRYYTRSLMLEHLARGEDPPRLVVRGHYHHYIHETVRVGQYVTDAFILPAYCGLGDYARQATHSSYVLYTGMAAIEIRDGDVGTIHDLHCEHDLRTREEL
jgi:hypothetical protein